MYNVLKMAIYGWVFKNKKGTREKVQGKVGKRRRKKETREQEYEKVVQYGK